MMTPTTTTAHDAGEALIAIEDERLAHNYHPLPVVVERGEGAWVTDVNGKRYLDCLAAYSAVNFGHGHPDLLGAAPSTTTASVRSPKRSRDWPGSTACCP